MSFFVKNRTALIVTIISVLLFAFLFKDVLFFGKTLRGEPYAQGVLPSGPVNYQRELGEFRGHTNDPGASSWYNDPNFQVGVNQLKHGYIPWWNPFNGTGTTLLASLQSGIMFPPKLIILFLSPTPFMFDVYLIFRILLAFVFTYLFLRLFKITRPISYISAFSFAFSGALFRYINLEHLNIDAFIPFYLFCAEYFLQKQSFKRWLVVVVALTFVILGGFPEASLFAFILLNLFFIFRWLNLGRNIPLLRQWIYANVVALLLTLPVVIPFVVHMSESWTIHDPSSHVGSLYLPFSVLFSLVTPYLFTPQMLQLLNINPYILLPGWIGGGILILASMGTLTFKKDYRIGAFFGVFGIISLLKDFGFPLVNWIGYLPVINQAIVFKYNNPSITFALVVAAAFFLQYLLEKKPNRIQILAGIVLFVIFYGSFILQFHHAFVDFTLSRHLLAAQSTIPKYFLFLIGITSAGLFTLVSVYLLKVVKSTKLISLLVGGLLGIIALETFISLPNYHPRRDKGYPKVNFLTNLRKQAGDSYRISGRDYVLFPDFSAPYEINDPRILDAMYLKGFYRFVKAVDPNFNDRFINLANDWLKNPSTLRSIGVKYILATNSLEEAANITDLNKDYQLPKGSYTIDGETRSILSTHPPFDQHFKVIFPKDTKTAYFYLAMNPAVWDPSKGDGVCASVSYSGQKHMVCTDPKNNPADRIWKKITIEKPEGKREIDLEINFNQIGSTTFDWAGMTDLISEEEAANLQKNFTLTKGFPVNQDGIVISSYTLKDAKKIAYFPEEVRFEDTKKVSSDVKNNLNKIDKLVFAEGKTLEIIQPNQVNLKISMKLNGDLTIDLPKNHPKYLFISQPAHNNLNITNEKGKKIKWFKANIGFILVDTQGENTILVSNGPNTFLKLLFVVLFISGLSSIILFRFKSFIPFLKKL